MGTVSKAVGATLGGVAGMAAAILGVLPDEIRAAMTPWQWIAALAVAGALAGAFAYFFPKNQEA